MAEEVTLFDLFNKSLVRREEKCVKYHLFYCFYFNGIFIFLKHFILNVRYDKDKESIQIWF